MLLFFNAAMISMILVGENPVKHLKSDKYKLLKSCRQCRNFFMGAWKYLWSTLAEYFCMIMWDMKTSRGRFGVKSILPTKSFERNKCFTVGFMIFNKMLNWKMFYLIFDFTTQHSEKEKNMNFKKKTCLRNEFDWKTVNLE